MKALEMIISTGVKKKSLVRCVISVLLLAGVNSCVHREAVLVAVDVYSLDWYMTTRYALNGEMVIHWKDNGLNVYKVHDQKTLEVISDELRKIKPFPDALDIDTRMVCVLHYSDSSRENLLFSAGTQLALYKGVVHERDSVLIQAIECDYFNNERVILKINRVPDDDTLHIVYYVEVLKGWEYLNTEKDLSMEMKKQSLALGEILSAKQLTSTIWRVKTER